MYFTAGDEKDIKKYALLPLIYYYSQENKEKKKHISENKNKSENENKTENKIETKNETETETENIFNNNEKIFKLYKKINYQSIENTFNYIFYKFKKGIFVIIKNNKLALYLPFSNINYKNNWFDKIYFSPEEKKLLQTKKYPEIKNILNKNIMDFQNKYPDQFKFHKIDFNRQDWYANNCIFRNQFPKYEGELNTNIFKNMLESLLKERSIPDVEFFINDRDFPILKKNGTEPYEHIFDSDKVKIQNELLFKNMAPIFSQSITDEFADILIPTNDDWILASSSFFTAKCSNAYQSWDKINKNWNTKKNICIFRGSATGCGINIENNLRLKAANISFDYPNILDAQITDWNSRPKKYKNNPIEIINHNQFRFKKGNFINNIEKSNYKYILNIDGNVSAFRLSSELSMNSVVLIVKSKFKLWFSHLLQEYIHFIPVDENLNNLVQQIEWCIANDKKCKKIAENAHSFFQKYLTKNGIFNYLQHKLTLINHNKLYNNLLDFKKINKNVAIILCYRNNLNGTRNRERKFYIQYMNQILKNFFNYHIYIIEQSNDNDKFNIGKLKNIGFEISSKSSNYDSFVFSDIDTIPDYHLLPYFYKNNNSVLSLAFRGTRYQNKNKVINKIFLGALINFNKNIFKQINGYPNNFYGWGGEDDALINRLLNSNINTIYYPKYGSVIDIEEDLEFKTINVENKPKLCDKDLLKYEKLYEDLKSWKNNGLDNLSYKILNENKINNNVTQITVDLLKNKDIKLNPNLYQFNSTNDWMKLGKIAYSKIKNMKYSFI